MLRNSDSAILSGISRPPNTAKPFAVEQIIQTLNAMAQKFSAKGILPGAYSDFAVSTPQGDKPRHPQLSKRRDSRKSFAYSFCDAVLPYILTHPGDIVARPCKTLQDVESAYRLIYKEYLARGYCAENPSQMHYNFYCILPESRTFVVEKSGVIVGTLSAFVDSPSGLPLESLYPAEVAKFRVKGRRLAEVGLLALDSDVFSRRSFSLTDVSKMSALFCLIKIVFDYLFSIGVTDGLITVHPKHRMLYEYLKFETIGEVKSYAGACGNLALPMKNDLLMLNRTAAKRGGLSVVYGAPVYTEKHFDENFYWTEDLSRKFLMEKLPLWQHLPAKARKHVSHCLGLEMTDDCIGKTCARSSSFKPRSL